MLIVVDNCEHLLDGISLVSDRLQLSPRVQMLATSRERLQLREEQLFPLYGLDTFSVLTAHSVVRGAMSKDATTLRPMRYIPQGRQAQGAEGWKRVDDALHTDAVQLFMQSAQRVQPHFALTQSGFATPRAHLPFGARGAVGFGVGGGVGRGVVVAGDCRRVGAERGYALFCVLRRITLYV
jgi:predicted ATPase